MALFSLAIPMILRHEGGFVNNSNDPGGATNFGVSLRWLRAQGLLAELAQEEGDPGQSDVMVVRNMTPLEASTFYSTYWWDKYNYTAILPQAVANKIFDMAVNLGAPRAHRMVQRAVGMPQDGVLGAKTLAEVNTMSSLTLLVTLQDLQAQFYRQLVFTNPALQPFLQGWLNRAYDRI